ASTDEYSQTTTMTSHSAGEMRNDFFMNVTIVTFLICYNCNSCQVEYFESLEGPRQPIQSVVTCDNRARVLSPPGIIKLASPFSSYQGREKEYLRPGAF